MNGSVDQTLGAFKVCLLAGMKAGTQAAVNGANSCEIYKSGTWHLINNNVSIDTSMTVSTWCLATCIK